MSQSRKIWAELLKTQYNKRGNFTKYIYKISTSFTHWTIERRYSDFEKLHAGLLNLNYEQKLPEIPSKIFWKKNSEENVNKRSIDLEIYLNQLMSLPIFLFSIEFINFVDMDFDTCQLLKKTKSFLDPKNKSSFGSNFGNGSYYKAKSADTFPDSNTLNKQDNVYSELFLFNKRKTSNFEGHFRIIEEFLRDLEDNKENQAEIVKEFEEFFDNQTEELFTREEILVLLKGIVYQKNVFQKHQFKSFDSFLNQKSVNGILYHIGNYSGNVLGSVACLQFLLNLIRFDKNYDSERYIQVFKSLEFKYISMMKLNELVKSRYSLLAQKALHLIKVFINDQFEIEKVFNYQDYVNLIEEINSKE